MSRLRSFLSAAKHRSYRAAFDFVSDFRYRKFLRETTTRDLPHLLMIDELIPDPEYGAGYPRAREILEAIGAHGWRVTFYPMFAATDEIERMRTCNLLNVFFFSRNGLRALGRFLQAHGGAFDAVLASRPRTIVGFKNVVGSLPPQRPRPYRIYDAEALFAPREELKKSLFGTQSESGTREVALAAELDLLRDADAIIAVSYADAEIFRRSSDSEVFVVGHRMVANPTVKSFSERNDVLFVGRLEGPRDESPNVDSLVWFVEEVMPELDELLGPTYRLRVAGRVNSDAIRRLASNRVVLHEVVEDLTPLYNDCKVFVASTRYAAGIPRKVHDAFAAGIPCVATSLLAGQLGMVGVDGVLVADEPAAFARRCFELYTNENLWVKTRDAALARLQQHFSGNAFDESLHRLLDAAAAHRTTE